MVCRLILGLFALAYALALVALAAGTFGLFGSPRDPLAGVFLVPLGLPWILWTGRLPDGSVRAVAALLAPLVNFGIIAAVCRRLQRAARLALLVVPVSGLLVAGCGSPGGKPGDARPEALASGGASETPAPARPLADTEWRLVEIQSMDDAVGTVRPDDSSLYTMRLNGDGSVAMRLNCNRANGEWSTEAGPDGSSGRFEFGPLAGTRALCPPPSLDERVTGQAPYVRSYLLKDGRLYLSLMADGGILVWEPHAEVSSEATPDTRLEAAILRASPSYTRAVIDAGGATGRGRYVYARVDLNGDGRTEVFAYLLGSIFCGSGGCNLLLFTADARDELVLVDEFPITRLPVIVSPATSNGWSDLFRFEAGGGAAASYVRHTFDGQHYVERERVKADKVPEGRPYFAGEVTFDKGIPLEPADGR